MSDDSYRQGYSMNHSNLSSSHFSSKFQLAS